MAFTGNVASVERGMTLPARGLRALAIQGVLLVSAAFLLPAAAHRAGIPVRVLLPMHWPVILAGLAYGWRAGGLIGLLCPSASFLLSGMPLPAVLPAMTLELASYGFLAGFFREVLRRDPFLSTGLALLGGRLVFIAVAVATGALTSTLSAYIAAALLPGLASALAQLLLLPPIAAWWVRREGRK